MLFFISALGAHIHPNPLASHDKILRYLLVIALQWTLFGFVWWGMRKRGVKLVELIGGSWDSFTAIMRDIGVALGFLLVSYLILGAFALFLRPGHSERLSRLLPHTLAEVAMFLFVAASAGFTEEVVFRGYLQSQFAALSHSMSLGLILQGIAFGASHGYQGIKRMLILGIFGWLLGLMAIWKRSLRPGMIAHGVQDGLVGILSAVINH